MEMMVASAVTAESAYTVTGQEYAAEGEVLKDGNPATEDAVLKLMGRVSLLCNEANLAKSEGVWKVEGDPTEVALCPFAAKIGLEPQNEQAAYPRVDAIPPEGGERPGRLALQH